MKIAKLEYGAQHDALAKKYKELGAELTKVMAERIALAQSDEPEIVDAQDGAAAQRVAELLGQAPRKIAPSKRDRLAAMAEQIRDLRSAIGVLDGQMAVERHRAEVAYRTGVAPDYKAKLRAVAVAMKSVHAAALDLHKLSKGVEEQGVSLSHLGVFSASLLGSPADPYSAMARFFREAIEMNVITKSEMPEELGHR